MEGIAQESFVLLPKVQLDHLLNIALTDNDLLSVKESARHLRISTVTLWALRKKKNIPTVRVGKKIFFSKSALNQLREVTNDKSF